MNLERIGEGISFKLSTKDGEIGINTLNDNLSVFLSIQDIDKKTCIHWPGEYEIKGVSFFVSPNFGKYSIVKVFLEKVRFVFFCDENINELSDDLLDTFGETDILCIEKSKEGLTQKEMKDLIEKVDPRILIACKGETANKMKDYSFPFETLDKLLVSNSSLPNETSEYKVL
jgi:hypothetical protein